MIIQYLGNYLYLLLNVLNSNHPFILVTLVPRSYCGFIDGIVNSHKQSKSPYGKLSYSYGGLIISKLLFHAKYPNIPGTLNIKDSSIIKNDPANNFELAIEFLDLLERIIKVKRIILSTFDPGKAHSSTPSGQHQNNFAFKLRYTHYDIKGLWPFSSTRAVRVFWHFLSIIEYWVTLNRPLRSNQIRAVDPYS